MPGLPRVDSEGYWYDWIEESVADPQNWEPVLENGLVVDWVRVRRPAWEPRPN